MGFPENVLQQDERVVVHIHPHWRTLIGPTTIGVVVVGLAVFGITALPSASWSGWARLAIGLVAIGLLLRYTAAPYVWWWATHYVFTTQRILVRNGVVSRTGRDVPLSRVNDVSFQQGIIDRMFHCGSLTIESAGEHSQILLYDIPQVEQVHSTLYKLMEDDREKRPPAPSDGT